MLAITARPLAPQVPTLIIRETPRAILTYQTESTGFAVPEGVLVVSPVCLKGTPIRVESSTTGIDVKFIE